MEQNEFITRLLDQALMEGLACAEVWVSQGSSFRARVLQGAIEDYQVSDTCGLGFRGKWQGKIGYSATQAFDEAAILQLINGVKESAELTETLEQDEIFAGEADYPAFTQPDTDIKAISAEEKLAACLSLEKAVQTADPRVSQVKHTTVVTATGSVTLRNTYGLHLHHEDSMAAAYASAVMPRGDAVVDGWGSASGFRFRELDLKAIAEKAAAQAADQLDATPVSSGTYRVILHRDAMRDLLSTFCGIFSAKRVQQKLSLLAGKEGEVIASPAVTLIDDPLLPGGFGSCPFDAEGSASRTKTIIEAGVLKTLLHNRKTAAIQGVETTGNACRASYASPIDVAPTNFFLQPGTRSPEELIQEMGSGLVITEVSGLHAGANPVSGDFSLLSKGYLVENGLRVRGVEQITVAGNFYRLLKQIRETANDLDFDGGTVGACTVDADTLSVSGQ